MIHATSWAPPQSVALFSVPLDSRVPNPSRPRRSRSPSPPKPLLSLFGAAIGFYYDPLPLLIHIIHHTPQSSLSHLVSSTLPQVLIFFLIFPTGLCFRLVPSPWLRLSIFPWINFSTLSLYSVCLLLSSFSLLCSGCLILPYCIAVLKFLSSPFPFLLHFLSECCRLLFRVSFFPPWSTPSPSPSFSYFPAIAPKRFVWYIPPSVVMSYDNIGLRFRAARLFAPMLLFF